MASRGRKIAVAVLVVVVAGLLVAWLCHWRRPQPAQDEAMAAGIPVRFFHQAAGEPDHFRDMDGAAAFTPAEVRGRNTWMVWTGGDEAFWDYLANHSFGTFDLLKTISSYPCSPEQEQRARANDQRRAREYAARLAASLGGDADEAAAEAAYAPPPGALPLDAVQPPGAAPPSAVQAAAYQPRGRYPGVCAGAMFPVKPGQAPYRYYSRDTRFCFQGLINEPGFAMPSQPDEYGLCLDRRAAAAPPEGFDEKVYGRASGVLGLRLYPNPNFDAEARRHWAQAQATDAFYTDPDFFADGKLVRPYRVGMACAFCHVSPLPTNPPADPENPRLANLSGTIGAQYFWFGRVFGANLTPDNFIWHWLGSQRPGAVDTSFVPADNLNNPRAMSAIFNLPARLDNGTRRAVETSTGGALLLPEVKQKGPTFGVPHVLWDGADSVGIIAALTRVYVNIGEYHQEWVKHIDPIVGFGAQSPITVAALQGSSVYWNATQERAADLAAYLIRAGQPMHLKDAPGGAAYLEAPEPTLNRGKVVFAQTCARCHSSKLPEQPAAAGEWRLGEPGCIGKHYLDCWDHYWKWTQTPEFKATMTRIVMAPDFLDGNFLSNDARIPVTVLKTEICSSMASNAVSGHVWDNFSSQSYKELPAVGPLQLYEPVHDDTFTWKPPGGGRGYQRVPSLVSIWATAPFLHNNEVGTFTGDPSVKGRMDAFDNAIHKLLWPQRRGHYVHTTDRKTDLVVASSALPPLVSGLARLLGLVGDGMVRIGPVPKGTPVNLLANLNLGGNDPRVSLWTLLRTFKKLKSTLIEIREQHLSDNQAADLLRQSVPDLIKVSACPDFVVDRGHEFGKDLPDADKEALIEFLKTF